MLLKHCLSLLGILTFASASSVIHGRKIHPHAKRDISDNSTQYDYIVVGSGPGGGPLSARLAQAGFKVLLIDAGNDETTTITQRVPALQLQSTEYDVQQWNYFVHHYANLTQQEQDTKMVYEQTNGSFYVGLYPPEGAKPLGILYPRAGTLGGCAAHNAMITVLPFDSDWTYIQELTGDDSWNPTNMRTYFEKLEKCEYLPNDVYGHGFNGWLPTSLTSLSLVVEDQKLLSLIISAATAMGQNILTKLVDTVTGLAQVLISDINSDPPAGDSTEGLYQVPLAVNPVDSTRAGPMDFVLQTANAKYPNGSRMYHLDIQLTTLVTKIRFDQNGSKPRAIGVDYLFGQSLYSADPRYTGAKGTPGSVDASREVIISGGTFESPHLLKLSGIGAREELESFDIPVVVDLPGVGTNMQDRYEITVVGEAPTDFTLTKDCTFGYSEPDPCLEQWEKYPTPLLKGTYATNGIAIAILKRSTVADSEEPDLFISGAPADFKGYFPGYAYQALGVDKKHWAWITLKAQTRNTAGTVTLKSSDPQEMPNITFNYFYTGTTANDAWEKDLQAVYEGVKFSQTMYQDLIPLDGDFTQTWPYQNVTTESELKQYIVDNAWGHHCSCSCPIGADDDPMAVLDSQFRVRGVDGLRVVDASVFPKIPGYYIALPIYIISEKAAAVIINGTSS